MFLPYSDESKPPKWLNGVPQVSILVYFLLLWGKLLRNYVLHELVDLLFSAKTTFPHNTDARV